IDLMDARAAVVAENKERIDLLRAAIAVAGAHPVTPERAEQLNQRLLALDPDDRRARARLLQFNRRAGRYRELAPLLADSITRLGEVESEERHLIVAERVRVLDRALEAAEEAESAVRAELERHPNDEALLLWVAANHRRRGDEAGYVAARQKQVKLLPARL